jgi:V/A-type H+-transporting ATPase subunit E
MERIQQSKDKIQKICDVLKKETLEPAKQEVKQMLENAKMQADQILLQAKKEAESILKTTKEEQEKQNKIFASSLNLACRQTLEGLKEQIQQKLFNENISQVLQQELRKSDVLAKLINTIVEAIQKEGTKAHLSAYIPREVPAKEVNDLLLQKTKEMLEEKGVVLGDFFAGVKVEMKDDRITLDITDDSLKHIVASYIQRDFRDRLFSV